MTGLRFVRNWIGREAGLGELIQARTITAGSSQLTPVAVTIDSNSQASCDGDSCAVG